MSKMEKSSKLAHVGRVTVRHDIGTSTSDGHGKRMQPETQAGTLNSDEYKRSR